MNIPPISATSMAKQKAQAEQIILSATKRAGGKLPENFKQQPAKDAFALLSKSKAEEIVEKTKQIKSMEDALNILGYRIMEAKSLEKITPNAEQLERYANTFLAKGASKIK